MLAVAVFLVTMLVVSACQSTAAAEPPQALLDIKSGEVEVLGFRQTEFVAGFSDQELHPGDRIRVGPDAEAAVIFFDGAVAMLRSSTTIIIEEISGSRESGETAIQLFQTAGRSFHRVQELVDAESSYAVWSSASVGLVRGTVFIVEVDADTGDTAWKTVEGTVQVAGAVGLEVSVVAGTATTIQLGAVAAVNSPRSQ